MCPRKALKEDIGLWAGLSMSKSFPDGSVVKNLPAMQETRVLSLGQENLLEKEMATHSSILAWEIPWTEKPDRLQCTGSQKIRTRLSAHTRNLFTMVTSKITDHRSPSQM